MQDFMTRTALNEANSRGLPVYSKGAQNLTTEVAVSNTEANALLPTQDTQLASPLVTKDRLWNLVFWFGISSGLSLATFVKFTLEMPILFLVTSWSVLLGVPLIVTLANRTRFITKDTFANSEDKILTPEQIPTGNFIWLTALGIALTFVLSDKYAGQQVISSFLLFTGLLSGFSLYFIFKNCPISILFNYKFWQLEFYYGPQGNGNKDYYSRVKNNSIFSGRPENIYIDHKNR